MVILKAECDATHVHLPMTDAGQMLKIEFFFFLVFVVIAYKATFFTRLSLMKSIIYNYEAQILGDTGWKWIRVMDMEI